MTLKALPWHEVDLLTMQGLHALRNHRAREAAEQAYAERREALIREAELERDAELQALRSAWVDFLDGRAEQPPMPCLFATPESPKSNLGTLDERSGAWALLVYCKRHRLSFDAWLSQPPLPGWEQTSWERKRLVRIAKVLLARGQRLAGRPVDHDYLSMQSMLNRALASVVPAAKQGRRRL